MLKGSAMHRLVAFAFVALIGFAHAADKGEQWAFLILDGQSFLISLSAKTGSPSIRNQPVCFGLGISTATVRSIFWFLTVATTQAELVFSCRQRLQRETWCAKSLVMVA